MHLAVQSRLASLRQRLLTSESERGEGVISAAIAVLVMAFLGVAMWLAFERIFDNAQSEVDDQVSQIGG